MDKYFRIETISKTPNPQLTCWLAMHQDYSSYPVIDTINKEWKHDKHLVG